MNAIVAPWQDRRSEDELKKLFAQALLECNFKPYFAARQVFTNPTDGQRALTASEKWPNDPIVKAEQARLIDTLGEEAFLPSKVKVARDVYDMAMDEKTSVAERLAAMRFYSDLRQFIPKDTKGVQVNVNNNRVMIMPDYGSDDDWERKTIEHQQKTIENLRD